VTKKKKEKNKVEESVVKPKSGDKYVGRPNRLQCAAMKLRAAYFQLLHVLTTYASNVKMW